MKNQAFWENYGYVERGNLRKEVIKHMNEPKTPSKLAKELKIHLAEASRVLIELTKRKLAVCLTPNLLSGRIYDLTEEGKKIRRSCILN